MTMTTLVAIIGIACYMAITLAVAWLASRRNQKSDPDDWFIMGRGANLFFLVGTLFATWFSTFAFLGGPGTFFGKGANWLLFGFFNSMGPLLIMFIGTRIWRLGKEYNFITPADLLSCYYDDSRRVRVITAVICVLALFPYVAIQLSGIAISVQSLTEGFISYSTAIFGIAACVAIYAIFGGSRAVVWTDAFQGFIFAMLLIGTAILVIVWSGGWENGWNSAIEARPEQFLIDHGQGGSYVTLMLLWTFGWILTPHLWQRLYMANSAKTLVMSSMIASFLSLIVIVICGAIIGFFALGMPLQLPTGFTPDALVPEIYRQYLPLMGAVLVIAVFAAGMSTVDSQVISASSIFTRDLYSPLVGPSVSLERSMSVGRWFELAFLIAVVAFSLSPSGRQLLVPLASIGVGIALCFLMPLIGALFWPRATEPAAFWSMLAGGSVMLALQLGLKQHLPNIIGAPLWGFLVSAILFYTISLRTPAVSARKQAMFHGFLASRFPETISAESRRDAPHSEIKTI